MRAITDRRGARLTLGAAVVLMALTVIGCDGKAADSSPVMTTSVDLPPSYRFAPTAISVAAGATVTWTNHDNFSHSVAFLDGGLPAEPRVIKPGETTTFTFSTPGTFHYQCSFHPQDMKGTVVVAP